MFPYDFLSEPVNTELACLIVVAPLSDDEKQDWLKTLPLMTTSEKKRLAKNLQEEIRDISEVRAMSLQSLNEKIQTLFTS